MSLDKFHTREYDRDHYNCAHFVSEVWFHLTKENISEALGCFLKPVKERKALIDLRRKFDLLIEPKSPCIVLMQRKSSVPHVGVFYKGNIIHLHENGVEYVEPSLATRGFNKVKYYVCKQ